MKKFFFIALALLVFVGLNVSADKIPLRFLYYIDASQTGYAEDQAIWQKFKDDNPDIDLQMEILFNNPYHEKLGAYIAAGNIPDVIYMWPSEKSSSAILHKMHLMKDLTPLLGKEFLSHFVSVAIDPKAAGIRATSRSFPRASPTPRWSTPTRSSLLTPASGSPRPTRTSRRWFPLSRQKAFRSLPSLTETAGRCSRACSPRWSAACWATTWVDKVKTGKVEVHGPRLRCALTFIADLFKDGVIPRADMTLGYGDGPNLFVTGKAAMIIDGDWRQGFYITDKSTGQALIPPDKQASDYAFINFPAIPGEKYPGVVSAIAGVGLGICQRSPQGLRQGEGGSAAPEVLLLPRGPEDKAGDRRVHSHPQGRDKRQAGAVHPDDAQVLCFHQQDQLRA